MPFPLDRPVWWPLGLWSPSPFCYQGSLPSRLRCSFAGHISFLLLITCSGKLSPDLATKGMLCSSLFSVSSHLAYGHRECLN
jgi:hypothetical protein